MSLEIEDMRTNFVRWLFVSALFFFCSIHSGCALIMNGTSQEISVSSNPNGASVLLNGTVVGKTPTTLTLTRGNEYAITLNKEGYLPTTCILSHEISVWFWGALFEFTGPFEFLSYIKGSLYNLAPGNLYITLTKDEDRWRTEVVRLDTAIEPGIGWKDLLIGMTGQEVCRVLGKPDEKSVYARYAFLHYHSKGIFVYLFQNRVKFIFFNNGGGRYPALLVETDRGIGFKNTIEDVLRVYGKPKSREGGIFEYDGVAFIFKNGKMIKIKIFAKLPTLRAAKHSSVRE